MRTAKPITNLEKRFAELLAQNYSACDAARKAFGWTCQRFTREEQKAKSLAASKRIKDEVAILKAKDIEEAVLQDMVEGSNPSDWESLHQYAFRRLKTIRDNTRNAANVRYEAMLALEKLSDPAQDINLIWKYIDSVWEGMTAHCPCCHKDFPLSKVKNAKLDDYRKVQEIETQKTLSETIDRRLLLISKAEKRRKPHKSQMISLAAPERNIVALGLARGGKCHSAEDLVLLSDGRTVKAKKLINKTFSVLAYGPNGKQIKADAWAEDNGIQSIYRITTKSGRCVERTHNHPLLSATHTKRGQGMRTQMGQSIWKEIKDLKISDMILVPTEITTVPIVDSFDPNECKLLGYLLGDGGTTHNRITFTQEEGPCKEEFKTLVTYFDCNFIETTPLTLGISGSGVFFTGRNKILNKVREWKIDCKSIHKRIPQWAWQLPNEGLAIVLNRLYACDGWGLKTKGEIGITLGSKKLAEDIRLALLRFGINGAFRYKKSVCTNAKGGPKECDSWGFYVNSKQDIKRFAEKIGILGKEKALDATLALVEKRRDKADFRKTGCPVGYYWDEIKSIEYLGELPSVAISVPYYHTYITTVVDHNSFNLAMIALIYLLIPGANIWLLARVYDDAKYEFEYLQHFLFTMFYPVEKHMYTVTFDKKTGDASIITRWNSEITIKSGKSKGSITGQELDAMLVAEPGWVDGELFEEVRARMSSRLGRIFAFGTPKGTGGFLGRLLKMSQRDMSTGKKLELGARLIKNGAEWGKSLLVYNFDAADNPEYVMSEIEAAKSELTESEFASEFQGKMVSDSNAKFPFIKPHHARIIRKTELGKVSAVLGVDQGEKNFAAVLLGWDGNTIFVFDEYFDNSDDTIKSNLIKLNSATYNKVIQLGLPPERWKLTIFDADPPIWGQLKELEDEGRKWRTDHTFRPKNQKEFTNWREETCAWINQLAKDNRIVFSTACDQLHDQLMEALKQAEDPSREGRSINRKGWVINDPWRGDHVPDAFLLACWTLFQNQITMDVADLKSGNVYDYLEQQFQFDLRKREENEMKGFKEVVSEEDIYEDVFGTKKPRSNSFFQPRKMWYPDA